jgi:hypothetical protein
MAVLFVNFAYGVIASMCGFSSSSVAVSLFSSVIVTYIAHYFIGILELVFFYVLNYKDEEFVWLMLFRGNSPLTSLCNNDEFRGVR